MRSIHAVLSALCLMLLVSHGAQAEERVALVIGNSSYKNIPALANPNRDAALMESTLRQVGFDVVTAIDADRRTMGRAIRNFGKALRSAGKDAVGLIYFAGHGIQARGGNYLIPIGATIEDLADLEIEALSASDILAQLESAGNRLNLVILDACRNNPLKGDMRSMGRGLARIKAASGTLVAFAAAPGQVASDGALGNSPYTAALAKAMVKPGLTVEQMFKQVRVSVEDETGGQQTPWEESSLRGEFYFTPAVQTTATQSPAAQTKQPSNGNSVELVFWNTIKDSQDPALFNDYLKQYPNGLFAGLARTMIGRLEATMAQREASANAARQATDIAYWNSVKDSPDKALIQSYLDRFPDGVFSTLAQLMISRLDAANRPADQVANRTVPSNDPAHTDAESQSGQQQLASIEPGTATDLDQNPDLPRMIQAALADAGCDPGGVDGQWGRNSQRALDRFARYANLTLPDEPVSGATLRQLRRHDGRVCPLSCNVRQIEKNGRCIAKTCPAGQKLSNSGECRAKSQAKTNKKPGSQNRRKKRRSRPAECDDYIGNALICRE